MRLMHLLLKETITNAALKNQIIFLTPNSNTHIDQTSPLSRLYTLLKKNKKVLQFITACLYAT